MTAPTTYPLRLLRSVRAEAEALSKADGTSLNQFVATAVAEKIAVLKTAAYFEERAERARAAVRRGEPSALLAALSRSGGEPRRDGDELPQTGPAPCRARRPASRPARCNHRRAGRQEKPERPATTRRSPGDCFRFRRNLTNRRAADR